MLPRVVHAEGLLQHQVAGMLINRVSKSTITIRVIDNLVQARHCNPAGSSEAQLAVRISGSCTNLQIHALRANFLTMFSV